MNTELKFKAGDRIRYSQLRLKPARDWWLSRGRWSEKSAAKDELDKLTAERGTVLESFVNRFGARVVKYRMDSGAEGEGMDYNFEKA